MTSAVIGSGAWGRALQAVFRLDHIISARGRSQAVKADYIFLATEAQKLRQALLNHEISPESILVICSKGIEQNSLKLLGEVVEEILPNKYMVLSGPNFADEVKADLPAATTIACRDAEAGREFISRFARSNLRLYLTDDLVGTQIGGAVKNVIAIAAGIATGMNLGENARAAIISRGIAETVRLAITKGGRLETLMGLSGFGDLILTATSEKSRNMAFGLNLAKKNLTYTRDNGGVVEGYHTAKSVREMALKLNVEMPICFSVYEILYNNKDIGEAVNDLLKRPQG